jgi:hypothetical protein
VAPSSSPEPESWTSSVASSWRAAFRVRTFRRRVGLTVALLLGATVAMCRILPYVEARTGVVLDDPLLDIVPPIQLSDFVFALLYGSLLFTLAFLANRPHRLVVGGLAFALVTLLRGASLCLVPLEPPPLGLPLSDPFIDSFGSSGPLTRDLFFSGHVATMVVLALAVGPGRARLALSIVAGVISIALLVQQVHYSIDIVAAVVVAYATFAVVARRWQDQRPGERHHAPG